MIVGLYRILMKINQQAAMRSIKRLIVIACNPDVIVFLSAGKQGQPDNQQNTNDLFFHSWINQRGISGAGNVPGIPINTETF